MLDRRVSDCAQWLRGTGECIHLGVENADGRLHDRDRLVEGRDGEESLLGVLEHGHELQTQVLRVHLGGEGVRDGLLLAAGNGQAVALAGQVAQDAGVGARVLEQGAADERHGDGGGLLVLEGEAGLGGMAVDQLDAEDLRLGPAGRDGDLDVGRLRVFADLFDALDLGVVARQTRVDVMARQNSELTSISAATLRACSASSNRLDSFQATMMDACRGSTGGG